MELVRELNKLIGRKLTEQEQLLKNMAARGEFDVEAGGKGAELKAKKEKNLMEFLEITV